MRGYQREYSFAHMDDSGLRGNSHKQWVDYVREDLQTAGLHTHGGENHKTGLP